VSFVYAKSDIEMQSAPRSVPDVKASLSVYNFIEELRMQELTAACGLLHHWCEYRNVSHEMLEVGEILTAVEAIIKKVIEMARMVTTFKELCEMEQIALLKGAVTEVIILRSVLNYVPEKDSWVFNLDEVSARYTAHCPRTTHTGSYSYRNTGKANSLNTALMRASSARATMWR